MIDKLLRFPPYKLVNTKGGCSAAVRTGGLHPIEEPVPLPTNMIPWLEAADWSEKPLLALNSSSDMPPVASYYESALLTGQNQSSLAFTTPMANDPRFYSQPLAPFGRSGSLFRAPKSLIVISPSYMGFRAGRQVEESHFSALRSSLGTSFTDRIFVGTMMDSINPFVAGLPATDTQAFSFGMNRDGVAGSVVYTDVPCYTKIVDETSFVGGEVLFTMLIDNQNSYLLDNNRTTYPWPNDLSDLVFFSRSSVLNYSTKRFAVEMMEFDKETNNRAAGSFDRVKWLIYFLKSGSLVYDEGYQEVPRVMAYLEDFRPDAVEFAIHDLNSSTIADLYSEVIPAAARAFFGL